MSRLPSVSVAAARRPLAATVLGAAMLVVASACSDTPSAPGASAGAPSWSISDGGHEGGNERFHFLAPLVQVPDELTGIFDSTLAPVVRICAWEGSACGATVAEFTTAGAADDGGTDERVRLSDSADHYIVNWHTGRAPLDPAAVYRIRVLVDGYELGHADVVMLESGRGRKSLAATDVIGIVAGRTLPIRFRIEEGAVPSFAGRPIAAGRFHACAVARGGAAYCWGQNTHGQLGNGFAYFAGSGELANPVPEAVAGGLTFAAIYGGESFSCALTTEQRAYCWGNNQYGMLGTGASGGFVATPVAVATDSVFASLTLGVMHACGLTPGGTALCWGLNSSGQLGTGVAGGTVSSPLPVSGGRSFTSLGAGYLHTCGVTTSAEVYCWGRNTYGQIGTGVFPLAPSDPRQYAAPQRALVGEPATAVSGGGEHTCALGASGSVWCWGLAQHGQLGRVTLRIGDGMPAIVGGTPAFAAVESGNNNTCALTAEGVAYCWGNNRWGQLGNGYMEPNATTAFPTPSQVPGPAFRALALGSQYACGLTTSGAARCWGLNSSGQLGTGDLEPVASPTDVVGGVVF